MNECSNFRTESFQILRELLITSINLYFFAFFDHQKRFDAVECIPTHQCHFQGMMDRRRERCSKLIHQIYVFDTFILFFRCPVIGGIPLYTGQKVRECVVKRMHFSLDRKQEMLNVSLISSIICLYDKHIRVTHRRSLYQLICE